nr:hypothetical protein Iba_chr01bCG2860 [Ipomoea batatas]
MTFPIYPPHVPACPDVFTHVFSFSPTISTTPLYPLLATTPSQQGADGALGCMTPTSHTMPRKVHRCSDLASHATSWGVRWANLASYMLADRFNYQSPYVVPYRTTPHTTMRHRSSPPQEEVARRRASAAPDVATQAVGGTLAPSLHYPRNGGACFWMRRKKRAEVRNGAGVSIDREMEVVYLGSDRTDAVGVHELLTMLEFTLKGISGSVIFKTMRVTEEINGWKFEGSRDTTELDHQNW